MWEVLSTLHRLQSRGGRGQFAAWYRTTRADLHAAGLARPVREVLFALYPLGPYLPDFLTPAESEDGLGAGLDGILRLPAGRSSPSCSFCAGSTPCPPGSRGWRSGTSAGNSPN